MWLARLSSLSLALTHRGRLICTVSIEPNLMLQRSKERRAEQNMIADRMSRTGHQRADE